MTHHRAPTDRLAAGFTALRFEGRDVLGVLHRISTATLEDLRPGEARVTLFCDFRARLLHRAAVAHARDGAVWVLRPDAPGDDLLAHIEKHVFREDLKLASRDSLPFVARYGPPLTGGAIEEEAGQPRRVMLCSGEIYDWTPDAAPGDERERIHAGLPRHGHEIRDAWHPFEVGLAGEVHLSKGCYTGQETLQRLITYGGVRRRLAKLAGGRGAAPAPGAAVFGREGEAGRMTSVAADGAGWVALAVLRRDFTGSEAEIERAGLAGVAPFPELTPQGLP